MPHGMVSYEIPNKFAAGFILEVCLFSDSGGGSLVRVRIDFM